VGTEDLASDVVRYPASGRTPRRAPVISAVHGKPGNSNAPGTLNSIVKQHRLSTMTKWTLPVLVGIGTLLSSAHGMASAYPPDAGTLALIAREIEGLKREYPQLGEFSSQGNLQCQGAIDFLRVSHAQG
jgi:hypothetical protein